RTNGVLSAAFCPDSCQTPLRTAGLLHPLLAGRFVPPLAGEITPSARQLNQPYPHVHTFLSSELLLVVATLVKQRNQESAMQHQPRPCASVLYSSHPSRQARLDEGRKDDSS